MWGGNSIAARVQKVIKQRVADAQKEHDAECKAQDAHCEQMKREAEKFRDSKKEEHALAMVERILGK